MTWHMSVGLRTLCGPGKSANEDTAAVAGLVLSADTGTAVGVEPPAGAPLVALLADGMGGQIGGRMASRSTIELLAADGRLLGGESGIVAALEDAQTALYEEMRCDSSLTGMGTTLVGISVAQPDFAFIFNIGDSRLLLRNREIGVEQLTVDDAEQQGSGTGPLLSQCLGGTSEPVAIKPHVSTFPLGGGDRVLLCSDGLSDVLDAKRIGDVLALDTPPTKVANELVALARRQGARDDVTVVVLDIFEADK
jgi:serine/threonine protein phosphatase PrpC